MAESVSHLDLSKMKVADLKKELKIRGLSTVGNKTELMERLQVAYNSNNESIASEDIIDDDLNDDELEDDIASEDVEKTLELDDPLISPTEVDAPAKLTTSNPLKLKRKLSESTAASDKTAPKKIVLNRALSKPTDDQNIDDKSKTVDSDNAQTEEKKVIKFSNLSAKERLEMRAKKFGVTLTADQKKVARLERFGSAPTSTIGSSNGTTKIDLLKKRAERFGGNVSTVMSKLEGQERLEQRKARFGVIDTTKKTAIK